jgi:hypothetical protein
MEPGNAGGWQRNGKALTSAWALHSGDQNQASGPTRTVGLFVFPPSEPTKWCPVVNSTRCNEARTVLAFAFLD